MKIRKQPDLARLITDLDKKKDGTEAKSIKKRITNL